MAINNPLKKVAQFLGFSTRENPRISYQDDLSLEERRQIFRINESYYNNNVYDRLAEGGALDLINDFLGEAKANDIKGVFNPVKRSVEVYAQNVFAGAFGKDIKIKDTIDGRPVHQNLIAYANQIAKWSNFNQELKHYVRYGALFGTVGIRVISKLGKGFPNDDPKQRRVYLEFEHPSTIINAIRDKRGNVKQIITEYIVNKGELQLSNRGEHVKKTIVRELMTQDTVERVTDTQTGLAIVPFLIAGQQHDKLTNKLGVVPYVIVQHEKKTGLFGSWSFQGVERKIDITNALSAHIDRQIVRHVKATWAVASSGEPPDEFNFSGNKVIWFQLDEGVAAPVIQDLVANLSLSETMAKIQMNLDEIADSLPELKSTDGKYLSGQSGETIAQLRLPAEVKIKSSRSVYEDGLIRAMKLAFSWGILLGIMDFGTGTGTQEAATLAFESGAMDFEFEDRDALPITESERLNNDILRSEAGLLAPEKPIEQPTLPPVTTSEDLIDSGDVTTSELEDGE